MELTGRDLDIIGRVHALRFATCRQIHQSVFGGRSLSACKRRLTLLYHNRFLDRRYLPIRSAYGANQAVYCLDRRGVDALTFHKLINAHWRPKDNDRELYFLEHLVATNDVRLALEMAALTERLELSWIDERRLRIAAQSRARETSLNPVIFDGLALLDGRGTSEALAIELDRGTVEERQFRRKIEATIANWRAGALRPETGERQLRILFVCTPTARDRHRLSRIKSWTEKAGGRGLFWFAPFQAVMATGLLVAPLWEVAGRDGRWGLFSAGGRDTNSQ